VGLHIGRRHQPDLMPQSAKHSSPMMRRATCLYTDQRRRKLGEERLDLRAAKPPLQYNFPTRIDPVHLEHVLRDIESDCDSLRHGRSPLLVRITNTSLALDAVGGRPPHHCERSEAIQGPRALLWIASSPFGLLAMTNSRLCRRGAGQERERPG